MDDNENRFEVISSKTSKANFKHTNGFGKTVLLPFCSGIVGCALVIGTCFGVPSIKNKIIGSTNLVITENFSAIVGSNVPYFTSTNWSGISYPAANTFDFILTKNIPKLPNSFFIFFICYPLFFLKFYLDII